MAWSITSNAADRSNITSQDSLFSPEQIACYIGSVEKKINDEEDEKIKFDPKIIPPRKSYSRHFEIVIALKKFIISSSKWMEIPPYKYKFQENLVH
jgi:hypothetical protein